MRQMAAVVCKKYIARCSNLAQFTMSAIEHVSGRLKTQYLMKVYGRVVDLTKKTRFDRVEPGDKKRISPVFGAHVLANVRRRESIMYDSGA